jgi:tetratricopeptide (TPR) repeat protein
MDESVRRAAFKKRWNEVAGLKGGAFEPALDEERAFYRFLLEHPLHPRAPLTTPPALATAPPALDALGAYEGQYMLKKIDELSALDPAYPADFARGIILYRLGRYLPSAEAFRRHLDASPDGPFTLRAQNYLRSALEQTVGP